MYNYNAYNLGLSSALPLPELQASAEVVADVTITLGRLDWSPPESVVGEEMFFDVGADEAYFFWERLGKFRVRAGREIVIDPCSGVEERLLRLPLLGAVFAVLLHQRGRLVLHASAVAIDGQAIVFIGNKGHGKSTMAAKLYGRGHQLIADDVVALDVRAGRIRIMPGFPQFKLHLEAAISALGANNEPMSELAEGYEKLGKRVTDRFAQQPLPLKSIYVLGRGDAPGIKKLEPQDALLTLIANSYMARFGSQLLNGAEACMHLRQCTSLMAHVPVYRLERPDDLDLLPSLAQSIENHLQDI